MNTLKIALLFALVLGSFLMTGFIIGCGMTPYYERSPEDRAAINAGLAGFVQGYNASPRPIQCFTNYNHITTCY